MLNGKSILVTGGTGSFGRKFIETVLQRYPSIKRLVVFSRDELKQYEMSQVISQQKYPQVRYFIGDIRDRNRLIRACEGIDIIIHAAALKQVPAAEYNPMECIRTNILGSENVIDAALETKVQKVIALSTDKAAAPINLYGATKLCSDKLFVAANNIKGDRNLLFSVVRYGNVLGSRGSVIPHFLGQKDSGKLTITDEEMTRFSITLDEAVEFVLKTIKISWGGEIFIPRIPSYRILDVAKAIAPKSNYEFLGIRPGEKIHEEMITQVDSINTIEFDSYFVIIPSVPTWSPDAMMREFGGRMVKRGFQYNSGENTDWLTVEDIRILIKNHVDRHFSL